MQKGGKLNRAMLLAGVALRQVIVLELPEFGGQVGVLALDGAELQQFHAARAKLVDAKGVLPVGVAKASIAAFAVCDAETRERLFAESDIAQLATLPPTALDRIFLAFDELNLWSQEANDKVRANFTRTPALVPAIGSP